jgi:hypothetical protein
MTRGRSRKKKQTSRKSTDENNHSQSGQGEEIATPPAQRTSPRRGRPEKFIELNPNNPLQSEEPRIGNDSFMQPLQSAQMPVIKIKIFFVHH